MLNRERDEHELPSVPAEQIRPGEHIVGVDSGGGGYGNPLDREPEMVRADVLEGGCRWRRLGSCTTWCWMVGRRASLAVDKEATVN